jgi:hypothetical protein
MASHTVKTTVALQEDLYHRARRKTGKRGLSHLLNELLRAWLGAPEGGNFGTLPRAALKDIRDHQDRL